MASRKHADYIYRNQHDTLRLRVHRRQSGRWDYDVFYPSGKITTYSSDGDDFATKRAAIAEAIIQHGPLYAIAVEGNVTDAAWHSRASRLSRAHSSKKRGLQLDRDIASTLSRQGTAEARGNFYLTDSHERPLGPAFSSRREAKRAAMSLVREGAHSHVEVWHHWQGDRYMQGQATDEGWSDV